MGKIGVDDLEDLKPLKLDPDARAQLLAKQTERTFIFAANSGWPPPRIDRMSAHSQSIRA